MNKNIYIKLTNTISIIAIILLLYWVFTFISLQVFDFKIFRENITESFYLSIIGILAVLSGAVVVNVMFNLTKIADILSDEYKEKLQFKKSKKILFYSFILSFPLIFVLLYMGDYSTAVKKENHMVNSAKYIVDNNPKKILEFSRFNIDSSYISKTSKELLILSKEFESFPSISILHKANINEKSLFLIINSSRFWNKQTQIEDYIFSSSIEERDYLEEVFNDNNLEYRFSSSDGNYELFYPVKTENGIFIFYCTDSQRYGKIGS